MIMFNEAQWTGDYNAAAASRLAADMANFGATTLHMRVTIRGGPGSTVFSSTVAVDLPADGVWRPVMFDLTPSAMTLIGGSDTLADVLGSVNQLRILSAEADPAFQGDPIVATLGMDNLRVVSVTPPTPTSVVSRKTHGGAGPFDINLPQGGPVGIECRSGGAMNDYQVVVTFASPVTASGASVTAGIGSVSSATGSGTSTLTVNLTGVTNIQIITVTLNGVSGGAGSGNIALSMGVLVGDTNANAVVNVGDTNQTKGRSGQTTDATNFRSDVNTDGSINVGDTNNVKSRSGTALP